MLSPFDCIITSLDTNDQHHSQAYPDSRVVRLNCVVVIYKFIKRYKTCHIYKHVFMLIRRYIFYIATPNSWDRGVTKTRNGKLNGTEWNGKRNENFEGKQLYEIRWHNCLQGKTIWNRLKPLIFIQILKNETLIFNIWT